MGTPLFSYFVIALVYAQVTQLGLPEKRPLGSCEVLTTFVPDVVIIWFILAVLRQISRRLLRSALLMAAHPFSPIPLLSSSKLKYKCGFWIIFCFVFLCLRSLWGREGVYSWLRFLECVLMDECCRSLYRPNFFRESNRPLVWLAFIGLPFVRLFNLLLSYCNNIRNIVAN